VRNPKMNRASRWRPGRCRRKKRSGCWTRKKGTSSFYN
jgi:hypothetical protein